MDEIKDENTQEGGGGIKYASNGNIDGTTPIQLGLASLTLAQIRAAATEYRAAIGSKLVSGGKLFVNISGVRTEIKNGTASIPDRPFLLSDLLKLLDPTSDISAIFNVIPLAQFKHLPDPAALNPVTPGPAPAVPGGGGYEDETPTPVTTTTDEEMPSLVVDQPVEGGSHKRSKRSSHKKNKSARIRTKKNKKL